MRRSVPLLLLYALVALTARNPLRAASTPNPRFTGTSFLPAWTAEDYAGAPVNYELRQHPDTGPLYAAND